MIAWLREHVTLRLAGAGGIKSKAATVMDGLWETPRNGASPKPTFYKAAFCSHVDLLMSHRQLFGLSGAGKRRQP